MIKIEDIKEIRKSKVHETGYEIVFNDDRIIWLTKRRTIVGLLLLIKYGIATEEDLVGTNNRLKEIKSILSNKINKTWIKERYGDANKPFSELWTEEGFACIHAEGLKGNRQYVLRKEDHELLFKINIKSKREQISDKDKQTILNKQNGRCNFCNSILKPYNKILPHTYSKDRVTLEFDHRIPVDRGGKSVLENYQALCHYCNKSKRQMCFICKENCCSKCALVSPETSNIVLATKENIEDRLVKISKNRN